MGLASRSHGQVEGSADGGARRPAAAGGLVRRPGAPGAPARWWDGATWTEHTRDPAVQTLPPGPYTDTTAAAGRYAAAPSWAAGSSATSEPRVNALAIGSLVASLVWMGGLSSVAAIVLGVLAKQQIAASGGRERGEGMATAGIVLGIIGIVLPVLALVGGALFLMPFRVA